jgi:hypothetical protein
MLSGGKPAAQNGMPAVLRQETVSAEEKEPNNFVGSANRITLGETVRGTLTPSQHDVDYFVLASSPESRGPKRVIARTRGSGCCGKVDVWSEKEESIAYGHAIAGNTISISAPPADAYLIRISEDTGSKGDINYELLVQPDP